jgi:Fe2+ or Zn2+ uptake regulation protein
MPADAQLPDVHATVRDQLRRTRQRYTHGRQHLVELLVQLGRPVTIPDLLEHGAQQSQSSLYRNLAILEQAGAVRRLASIDDVARYELDEHLTEHHHHLVCSTCGRIDDIALPDDIERSLMRAVEGASGDHGYQLTSHRLELVGVCADCD